MVKTKPRTGVRLPPKNLLPAHPYREAGHEARDDWARHGKAPSKLRQKKTSMRF